MILLKRLLIGLALLIALPFVVALFVPKEFEVSQSLVVDRPRADVFAHAKASPPTLWDAAHPERGTGEQKVTRMVEPDRIDADVRFTAPFTATGAAEVAFDLIDPGHTRVKVTYRGQMGYPWNLVRATVADQIGRDIAGSLSALKTAVEKR